MASENWFICTVGNSSFHNWQICKENNLWGLPTGSKKIDLQKINKGDKFLVYWAGHGFIAKGTFNSQLKRPTSKLEAPWAGGMFRFGAIAEIRINAEISNPIKADFENQRIKGTNITATALRNGLSRIATEDATFLLETFFK